MRSVLAALMLSLFALPSTSSTSPDARIVQVPVGTITQNTYQNDALEIGLRLQDAWTGALIPAGSVKFAPDRPDDDPVNSCSKALFSSEPIQAESNPFGPKMTYFVFDQDCFPGAPFPESIKHRAAVQAFAKRVVHALAYTPYIPPGGADVGGFDAGGRAFITLAADKNVIVPGKNTAQDRTVHVNMLLMLTESKGYWVVVAEIVDDASKAIMQAGHFGVSKRH